MANFNEYINEKVIQTSCFRLILVLKLLVEVWVGIQIYMLNGNYT